ncbi:MAG: GNAT family N-acetyltransferase [Pseudomonadota bacterium]
MNITVHHCVDEVERPWRSFQETAEGYGFQTFEWANRWYGTIGRYLGARPCVVMVTDDQDAPLLLLPLALTRSRGITVLSFADGGVSDYNAPLVHPGYADRMGTGGFSAIWDAVEKRMPPCDVIHFSKMPRRIGDLLNPMLELSVFPYHENSYGLRLSGMWETHYRTRVKKRIRADSARQRRRLAALGVLRFVIVEDKPAVRVMTHRMIAQKRRRYIETAAPDLFLLPVYRQFYCEAADDLFDAGRLHLSALLLDDTVVATHWGMVHNGCFYFLLPTFEGGRWRKFSPGRLLLEHLLEWAFAHHLGIFDFTIGTEAYKMDWCDRELTLYETLLVRSSKGHAYRLGNISKRFIRQWPKLYTKLRSLRQIVK